MSLFISYKVVDESPTIISGVFCIIGPHSLVIGRFLYVTMIGMQPVVNNIKGCGKMLAPIKGFERDKTPYLIAAYVTDKSLPYVTADDAARLTHINVAFGLVKGDAIVTDHLKNLYMLDKIRSDNPSVKIVLSLGGWGAGGFSEAASTKEGRETFISTALQTMTKHQFDGLDLDWEYPCYGEASIACSPDDKVNFTTLCQGLREAIDQQGKKDNRHYILSIAAGADQYFVDGTEMDKVEKFLDYVQLMTYDMRGGFQTLTGHHTGLYTGTGDLFRISVDASVRIFEKAGVPKEKIVIGSAFYARKWNDVPDNNHGLYQMTSSFGGYGARYSELAENYINQNGFIRYWDDEAKAPYLFNGREFISYDDPESLKHKSAYIRDQGLLGIMYWEHSGDKKRELLQTLYEELNKK